MSNYIFHFFFFPVSTAPQINTFQQQQQTAVTSLATQQVKKPKRNFLLSYVIT
jgi:hypothetical protein